MSPEEIRELAEFYWMLGTVIGLLAANFISVVAIWVVIWNRRNPPKDGDK